MSKNKKHSDSEKQQQNTNTVFEEVSASSESLTIELRKTQTKEIIEYGVHKDNETFRARQNNDRTLTYSFEGSSPQGEANTLPTCVILVQALNEAGENWSHPTTNTVDDDVDCRAYDKDNNKKELRIQVVRAMTDETFWQNLKQEGQIERKASINELLTALKLSIEKKEFKILPPRRPHLVLALDATKLPVFIFDAVLKEYVLRYGSWTHSLGFQSVWLVGPLPSNTKRLDIKSSP